MTVREFCTRDVVITNKGSSITEVAQLMRKYHVGDVVVVERRDEQNIPVGIITDRDIVVQLIARGMAPDAVTAGEVMSSELIVARENEGIWYTMQQMRGKGVRRIPVVNDDGGLEGILAVDDLVELLGQELTLLARVAAQGRAMERLQQE
ncbi:CBS domain-containing protein [Desulfolithobacter dissulfuricans]|uniref:CBS domain-containing protein n=1 Tax=Desulfolithobacter dissulfuricans TaxID=2795293 RepID=A0A915U231_9BACT|nr:CBS domain-containing protein [Desulfolithobacter dissulfuricans]BCO09914.1 CBS domain-containing protein [Desulfolithobacter dissulfuricans]